MLRNKSFTLLHNCRLHCSKQQPLATLIYLNLNFHQLKLIFYSSVALVIFQVLNRHMWLVTIILDMADIEKFYWPVVEHHYLLVHKLKNNFHSSSENQLNWGRPINSRYVPFINLSFLPASMNSLDSFFPFTASSPISTVLIQCI